MAQSTLLDNCNPRLIQVDQSCGCTLTRANILAMTDEIFESQGLLEVGMDKLDDMDWQEFSAVLIEYCRDFNLDPALFRRDEFLKLYPRTTRPYGTLYAY
jgi:hypothetical protein